jgi:hypothetical protein
MAWELLESLTLPLEAFLSSVILFFPNLVAAVILLGVGWVVGEIVGRVAKELMIRFKVDHYIARRRPMLKLSDIFPIIFEWTIYLVFIQAAVQSLGVTALVQFVQTIINFIPGMLGAVVTVIVGYIFAEYVKNEIEKSNIAYSNIMGKVLFWLVVYVAIGVALPLVGIDATLVNNILLIIVASIGAGIAIALGLGLKDVVAAVAKRHTRKLR